MTVVNIVWKISKEHSGYYISTDERNMTLYNHVLSFIVSGMLPIIIHVLIIESIFVEENHWTPKLIDGDCGRCKVVTVGL